jgi:G3E family GTPase
MSSADAVRMVLVGGFLGAGKTTLLAAAGRKLAARGLNVGFITNDQAADLVDTASLRETGLEVREVAGACFCCKFDELIERTGEFFAGRKTDVLLSEPVGSCTDLSATVLQPIKRFFGDRFRVAPFSVVVDPTRLRQLLSGKESVFSSSVLYVYSKQLEEADIILLNKVDQLSLADAEDLKAQLKVKFPAAQVLGISALNGTSLDEWLDVILSDSPAGRNILEIDYDRYAEGEALLGWLNASVKLSSETPRPWREFMFELLRAFKQDFKQRNAEIAHLKLFVSAAETGLVGNLTSTRGMPFVVVNGTSGPSSNQALLILNARVHLDPAQLRTAVETVLAQMPGHGVTAEVVSLECFSPGRPKPTHRLTASS